MPIWCTILTVLPDELLRSRSSGSVGLLSSGLGAEAVMTDEERVIHNPFKEFSFTATHQMEQTERYQLHLYLALEMIPQHLQVYYLHDGAGAHGGVCLTRSLCGDSPRVGYRRCARGGLIRRGNCYWGITT